MSKQRACDLINRLPGAWNTEQAIAILTDALAAAELRGKREGFKSGAEAALRHVGIMDMREARKDITDRIAALDAEEGSKPNPIPAAQPDPRDEALRLARKRLHKLLGAADAFMSDPTRSNLAACSSAYVLLYEMQESKLTLAAG